MSNDSAFCPICPRTRYDVRLEMAERNYSGTGVDLMTCPSCKKDFFVTYKIDRITEVEL